MDQRLAAERRAAARAGGEAVSLLALMDLSKAYPSAFRSEVVLDSVCLSIEPGEWVALWGGRRSGKSTLLRIIAGLQRPDRGSVIFADCDLTAASPDRRARLLRSQGIALVCEWRPERNRTTVDHVARVLLCEEVTVREARNAAREALARAGVARCGDLSLRRLSPGELFRVGLAVALVRRPRLLLVDEPATLRSPSDRQELFSLLRELGRDDSMALLVASEDLDALRGARRSLAIGGGELREVSEPGVVLPFAPRHATM